MPLSDVTLLCLLLPSQIFLILQKDGKCLTFLLILGGKILFFGSTPSDGVRCHGLPLAPKDLWRALIEIYVLRASK